MKTRSGKAVSRYSFGTMQFGGKANAGASGALYAACREAGINFFDTAHAYTGGASETILGQLVAPEKDDVFVATKCAESTIAQPDRIRVEFDESRRRLGMESVDLMYLHRWDNTTPLEDTYAVLADWVRDGSVRYIGVSNYAAWQVMKAKRVAEDLGIEISFIQPMYNLVKRQVEVEILPMAMSEGFHICPYSPLGGGLLTGKYAAGDTGRIDENDMYRERYGPAWMKDAASALSTIAADIGTSAATLAVAWAARHPGVWGPITSARSVEQLRPSLDAMAYDMDDDLYERLCALAPTPPPATDRLEEA